MLPPPQLNNLVGNRCLTVSWSKAGTALRSHEVDRVCVQSGFEKFHNLCTPCFGVWPSPFGRIFSLHLTGFFSCCSLCLLSLNFTVSLQEEFVFSISLLGIADSCRIPLEPSPLQAELFSQPFLVHHVLQPPRFGGSPLNLL